MVDSDTQDKSASDRSSDIRGTNQSGMRARNERLVLSLVRQRKALPKAEIARMTGLSAQTVSVIMRQLEADGLLLRGEPLRGKVGQPSVPMRLNPDGAYFLGLKVGRRRAELIRTDFLGAVCDRAHRTYAYPTPEETLSFACESLDVLHEKLPRDQHDKIAGLGVAMPFFLWDWAQTLRVPQDRMDGWRTADLQASLAELYDFPVFLQNDATSACGAELVFGPAGGPRDFLYFYVGYFIGGGVVLNDRIYAGRGNAGALGPLPVPDREGRVGPLIDAASLYLLEHKVAAAGCDPQPMWQTADTWNLPDALVADWVADAAQGIAHAIVSSCSLIDFECVKIDGWLPTSVRDHLIEEIEKGLSQADLTGLERPLVMKGSIGPDARALGAASLPLAKRYLVDD